MADFGIAAGSSPAHDNRYSSASHGQLAPGVIRLTRLQRVMIGNGILILFMALVAGMGL